MGKVRGPGRRTANGLTFVFKRGEVYLDGQYTSTRSPGGQDQSPQPVLGFG